MAPMLKLSFKIIETSQSGIQNSQQLIWHGHSAVTMDACYKQPVSIIYQQTTNASGNQQKIKFKISQAKLRSGRGKNILVRTAYSKVAYIPVLQNFLNM